MVLLFTALVMMISCGQPETLNVQEDFLNNAEQQENIEDMRRQSRPLAFSVSAREIAATLIRRFESLRLQAYVCPAGKLTIGYGHTGKDVTPGLKLTAEEAETILQRDISTFAAGVEKLVPDAWKGLTDNQKAVLVSFAFNFGLTAFANSTMKKRIEEGNLTSVPEQLARWVFDVKRDSNGNVIKKTLLNGLVRRRDREAQIWMQG